MATILFNCIFLAMTETVEEAEYVAIFKNNIKIIKKFLIQIILILILNRFKIVNLKTNPLRNIQIQTFFVSNIFLDIFADISS